MRMISVDAGEVQDLHGKPVLARKQRDQSAELEQLVPGRIEHDEHVRFGSCIGKRRHERVGAGEPFADRDTAALTGQRRFLCGPVERNGHIQRVLRALFAFDPLAVCVGQRELESAARVVKIEKELRAALGDLHRKRLAVTQRHRRERIAVRKMIEVVLRFLGTVIRAGKNALLRGGDGFGSRPCGQQKKGQNAYQKALYGTHRFAFPFSDQNIISSVSRTG